MGLSNAEEIELLQLQKAQYESQKAVSKPAPMEASTAEKIAGHPVTRMVTGAGSQGLGVLQMLSHVSQGAHKLVGSPLRPGDWMDENIASGERMREVGRKDRGSEGFDWYHLLGSLVSPGVAKGGQIINEGKTLPQQIARAIPVSAVESASQPVTTEGDFEKKKITQALTGAAVGPLVPPIGAALGAAAGGAARAADLILPGGVSRITDRWLKSISGSGENRAALVDALEAAKNKVPGSQPTAQEAVAHLAEGSPILAAQKISAAKAGGPSTDFGQRTMEQQAARRGVLEDLANRGTIEQQRVGRALLDQLNPLIQNQPGKQAIIGKETPEKFLQALIKNDQFVKKVTGIPKPLDNVFNRKQMRDLLNVADEIKTVLQVKSPAQRTNLQGGLNVADETRTHLPQMLSRPMMLANAVLKFGAGQLEPKLNKDVAEKLLNPQLLATALKDVPDSQKVQVLKAILNSGNISAAGTAAAGLQEGR